MSPEEYPRGNALSERDVINVVDRTIAEYGVDPHRVYLMGNSAGGMGTYYLAAQYPGKWCAIGPSDGPVYAVQYPFDKIRYLSGAIIVHGDSDTVAPIAGSKALADGIRKQGVETKFVVVPNGSHAASWYMALPQIFDFFTQHDCIQSKRP